MAWLGKISSNLGNLGDLAGAVNKLSESVKNIERNFDSALGFEHKTEPIEAPSATPERRSLPTEAPVAAVIQSENAAENGSYQAESSLISNVFGFARANFGNFDKVQSHNTQHQAIHEANASSSQKELRADGKEIKNGVVEGTPTSQSQTEVKVNLQEIHDGKETKESILDADSTEATTIQSHAVQEPQELPVTGNAEPESKHTGGIIREAVGQENLLVSNPSDAAVETKKPEAEAPAAEVIVQQPQVLAPSEEVDDPKHHGVDMLTQDGVNQPSTTEPPAQEETSEDSGASMTVPVLVPSDIVAKDSFVIGDEETTDRSLESSEDPSTSVAENFKHLTDSELPNGIISPIKDTLPDPTPAVGWPVESMRENDEIKQLKGDLEMMNAALQGAARQSQMKADEISRLLIENEELKALIEDLQKKSSSLELDSLREEYQQRVGAAERKVYALTKERDTLRRELSKKTDSNVLLKEKDEIIKQVMAEGEELSKKQAVQEGTMRKLRAQIRELEEEKQRLNSKLQVEEGKVESIRKDKTATETALQEAVEKGQAELAALRDFYTLALNEAKEAKAKAEARADIEAKADLERRYRESADREMALLTNLDDLRQALSRTEQQAAFQEDIHRRELEELEKRCQAAEARYEELVAHMPDSTRPLLRQIEALQDSTAIRVEAWTGMERSLNSRLQEAEAKAAAAQERERAITERLSQTLSRIAVMEAQLSMLRAELSQLTRSLEKERQRASEGRQELLAATEMATTQEERAKQLEKELEDLSIRHKEVLKEERARRHTLEQEIDREKAMIADLRAEGRSVIDKIVTSSQPASQSEFSSSNRIHKSIPSVSSAGILEESFFSSPSIDSDSILLPRHSFSDRPPSPYVKLPGASLEQLESQLRQKEGELSSYFQRLASLESTRDSLAEELVKATTQGEHFRVEASLLPGLRAELDSLRARHTSALELMGERDEEVEELKADLADVKQMYREQITMLVGQIERLSATVASR